MYTSEVILNRFLFYKRCGNIKYLHRYFCIKGQLLKGIQRNFDKKAKVLCIKPKHSLQTLKCINAMKTKIRSLK